MHSVLVLCFYACDLFILLLLAYITMQNANGLRLIAWHICLSSCKDNDLSFKITHYARIFFTITDIIHTIITFCKTKCTIFAFMSHSTAQVYQPL